MSLTDDILMHYGMPRRSGRYPWGSGDNPYQHSGDFLSRVEELKKSNFTFTDKDGKTYTGEVAIAKSMGLSTTQFRTQMSLAKDERRSADVATANLWRRTAGWINANGTQKVKLTRGTQDGSTATDYNTDGNGYKTIANATPAGSSGGYISSMKTEAFGRLPVIASGSSSTYEADGMWYNNSQVNYACVGGYWANGLMVGPFCAYLGNAASDSYSVVGAALSCKPLAAA